MWLKHAQWDALAQDDALWLLSSFCTLHRVSFDPALFVQRYPPPIALSAFEQAADELALRCQQRQCGLDSALSWMVPSALLLKSSAAPSAPEPSNTDTAVITPQSVWALILNADETRVVLIERGMDAPVVVEIADLRGRYLGTVVSITPKIAEAIDPDGIEHRQARFGLHWFVPELLKHKTVWRDVLTASL